MRNIERFILELSRKAIFTALEEGELRIEKPNFSDFGKDEIEFITRKCGVFVTLRKGKELRGCIGTFTKDELWIQVQKFSVFSAMNDPRFAPVSKDELGEIKIEISILSDPEDVESINEIELGKHGIIIETRGKGGVLLPDVATEFGVMSPEEFLDLLCKKIGLSPRCWKHAKIKKFTTEKITE